MTLCIPCDFTALKERGPSSCSLSYWCVAMYVMCKAQVSGAEGGADGGATLWRHIFDVYDTGQHGGYS